MNDVSVEGATHRQVVELIKSSDQVLKLTVISIAPEVAEKLENNIDSTGSSHGGMQTIGRFKNLVHNLTTRWQNHLLCLKALGIRDSL